jgi:integrase
MHLFRDDPFYRGLFLFALYGRRWNEIATLDWKDIDLLDNTYTIRAENNKIGQDQTYDLPFIILQAINEIKEDRRGLVFKSPITKEKLYSPKNKLRHLKEFVKMPELTMHYFRHILVSAMGEMGTAGTILSASLGHTNLDTVNQFYLSANHTKASQETNLTIDKLVSNRIQ